MTLLFIVPLALVILSNSGAAAPQYHNAEVAKGKEVFQQCRGCHSTESDEKKVGPSLRALFRRSTLRNGLPVAEKNIQQIIEKGRGGMPSFSGTLSPKQMDQLLAYLKEL
jgi:mono/diheme cytochrome c family protein